MKSLHFGASTITHNGTADGIAWATLSGVVSAANAPVVRSALADLWREGGAGLYVNATRVTLAVSPDALRRATALGRDHPGPVCLIVPDEQYKLWREWAANRAVDGLVRGIFTEAEGLKSLDWIRRELRATASPRRVA